MWRIVAAVVGLYRMVMDATRELFIRILMGILIFLGYVLLSLFIYAIMRRIMVPQKLHTLPVHLQYTPGCSDIQCPFPQAELILNGGKKLLSSGQYYKILLELEIPETSANQEVGVFMVNLTFHSTDGRYLSSSARPAMIRFKSFLLQILYTLFFAVPLLLGLWEQKQVIELVLFESYYEPYGDGALTALVTVQNHGVQLYSTQLSIEANFSGFTYYLYQWPISMSVIVIISIFVSLCTCTVLMWVSDVVRDYDEQRRAALQRRRMLQARTAGQAGQNGPGTQRRGRGRQQVGSNAALPPALEETTGSEISSEETSTVTGVEDLASEMGRGQSTPPPSITPTEGSVTSSDYSTGFNDVLSSLHTLSRELDGQEVGVANNNIRYRTGH